MNKIYQKTKEIIKNNNSLFIALKVIRSYGFYFLNKIGNYKLEKIKFFKEVGYQLNLKSPKSYNEKIVWKKINDRNPLLPVTADKYKVRSYIKEVLGEEKAKEILIPLLYITDQPDTIPFEKLPFAFIVKPNHASGSYIIVGNGHFNKKILLKLVKYGLKLPMFLRSLNGRINP